MIEVKLTVVETNHILALLDERKREGSYYGRQDHYYARTIKIMEKLEKQLDNIKEV